MSIIGGTSLTLMDVARRTDGDGKIAESRSGYTDGSESHLIEKVRELMAE